MGKTTEKFDRSKPFTFFLTAIYSQNSQRIIRNTRTVAYAGQEKQWRFEEFVSFPSPSKHSEDPNRVWIDIFGFSEKAEILITGIPSSRSGIVECDYVGKEHRRFSIFVTPGKRAAVEIKVNERQRNGTSNWGRVFVYAEGRDWIKIQRHELWTAELDLGITPRRQNEDPEHAWIDILGFPPSAVVSVDGKKLQQRGNRLLVKADSEKRSHSVYIQYLDHSHTPLFGCGFVFATAGDWLTLYPDSFSGKEEWIEAPEFKPEDPPPPVPGSPDLPSERPGTPGIGTLELNVPLGSVVSLNGLVTSGSENELRIFESPLLQTGDTYPVRVQVQYRNPKTGELETFKKDVTLRPGTLLTVVVPNTKVSQDTQLP